MSDRRGDRLLASALVLETALAGIAVVGGWALGFSPAADLTSWETAGDAVGSLMLGVAATIPLFGMLWWLEWSRLTPIAKTRDVVYEKIVPLFRGLNWFQLGAIAVAAGVGEELLFRGLIQNAVERAWDGPAASWWAITVAAVIFGLVHWVTPAYVVLAAVIGWYLGWLYAVTGDLGVPMLAHALYDFGALLYLARDTSD